MGDRVFSIALDQVGEADIKMSPRIPGLYLKRFLQMCNRIPVKPTGPIHIDLIITGKKNPVRFGFKKPAQFIKFCSQVKMQIWIVGL